MFNQYLILAGVVAILIAAYTGYSAGIDHCQTKHRAEQYQVLQEIQIAAEKQAAEDQQTAQRYEEKREVVRTVYIKVKDKTHENIEKNSGYANCSLDADGLRLYNTRPIVAPDTTGSAYGALSRPP